MKQHPKYPEYVITPQGEVIGLRGRALKSCRGSRGYHVVSLMIDGRKVTKSLHVLVAEAYLGPRPDGMQACHNDGNKDNNRPDNIRWDTPASNYRDRDLHGTTARGARNGNSREARRARKDRHGQDSA